MRRTRLSHTVLVLALGVTTACGAAAGQDVRSVEAPATTTTAPPPTTTTAPPPTTAPAPAPTWPLTGKPAADAAEVRHPAVVVKVDNHAEARPQVGLVQADLVYELRVEGISRFAAVFHSTDAKPVGPVRSARTSDPDLLAGLRTPLLAWSGGNPGVRDVLRRAGGVGVLVDAGHDARPDDYWRDRSRRAPHNLFTSSAALRAGAPATMGAPLPVLRHGEPSATAGVPAAGAWVAFGRPGVPSAEFAWDAQRRTWRRFQVDERHGLDDSAHVDANGVQIAPTNVVVLVVPYRASRADPRSPEAVTLGTGRAIVLVGGRAIEATWARPSLADGWDLRDASGEPVLVAPGRTWIELVADGDVGLLGADRARELLAQRP